MEILIKTTDDRVAIINAINSQESVKDYLDKKFRLTNIVVYRDIDMEGEECTISCFFVSDGEKEIVLSSISPIVFKGVESVIAVTQITGSGNFEPMDITFRSRRTGRDRDMIYFVVG